MTPDRILPRKAWTSSRHTSSLDKPKRPGILFVHITDTPGEPVTDPARERAALRSIRDYHVNVRGWDDIAYSYLLCQPWQRKGPATVYVGRGRDRLPASQQGFNRGNWSVAVVAYESDPIMDRTVEAIAWLARYLGAQGIKGHRDVNDTSCPGGTLYARLGEARRLAGAG